MEIIKTGLTKNYVGYWTVSQAIKEATQNIVYGAVKSEQKPRIEYLDGVGEMEDGYVGFQKKHLYLGESEQRNDSDGLGNFGEGWKMFLLICARNNIHHKVETVGFSFYGRMSDTDHDVQVLEIVVEPNSREVGTLVRVECDEQEFKKGTMGFAVIRGIEKEHCGEMNVIPNQYGQLFINGVLIENQDTENPLNLHYAYHLKNRDIINRDRSQVDTEKAYEIISQIWSKEEDDDVILEYVKKAHGGELSEDIQRGAYPYSVPSSRYYKWKNAIAHVMGCKIEQMVVSSKNTEMDKEAEYRGYVVVRLPDKWDSLLRWVDIKTVQEVVKAQLIKMNEVSIDDLTDYERQVFKRAKIDVKKSLNLGSIKDLPTIKIVEQIVDVNGVTDALGLYERESKTIYIVREHLGRQDNATRILLHECIHWKTGANDNSEWFTRGFENAILNLLGYNQ